MWPRKLLIERVSEFDVGKQPETEVEVAWRPADDQMGAVASNKRNSRRRQGQGLTAGRLAGGSGLRPWPGLMHPMKEI